MVVVSFTMDITFTFVSVSDATQDYAGLLVLLRLWRVTRIINGMSGWGREGWDGGGWEGGGVLHHGLHLHLRVGQ